MSYINNKQYTDCKLIPKSDHVIEVVGLPQTTSGFTFYLDNDMAVGHYENYTTVYKVIDSNTIQYSNDGSIWVEPEPIPEPEPYVPTEEELAEIEKQNKISELQSQISLLKNKLLSEDYIIIKLYELSLVGETSNEYNVQSIHEERDAIRTQINDLQSQINVLKG